MSKAKPLFELEKDFDEKELLMQKLTQNFDDGSTTKRERPAVDGSSIEALFYGIEEYGEACKGLQWDAYDELIDNFPDSFFVAQHVKNGTRLLSRFPKKMNAI